MRQKFEYVKINLASPTRIREWAERVLPNGEIVGEVLESDTINYRTTKPEKDGLFCEKTFGPVKNWECGCGRHKNRFDAGKVCEECGVEITESRVRRYRMGYVKLEIPILHIWYFKSSPSFLATVLNYPVKAVDALIYGKTTIPNILYEENSPFAYKDFITEKGYLKSSEVLYERLENMDLESEIKFGREIMICSNSNKAIESTIKRIRILENFLSTNTRPEWMILTYLPVIPPGIRPIVQLESGRFASSDLNLFYRRIIIRNTRLKRLKDINAPATVVNAERRLIQEAIDTLIDNGKKGALMVDINNRPLKSLAEIIEGKQGRFRQNLLGKRTDYSGRSVIVVGPQLRLNQCGLPFEMATELFLPFLIHKLIEKDLASSITRSKKIIYTVENKAFIWGLLKDILKRHPVFLNRAPTLHRLGVQAFDAVLIEGRAIQLHPLVCPAFNADFDGDQMAVHVPLSFEAQLETRLCLLATNNLLSPATGEPVIQPTQDMVLGFYYLTAQNKANLQGENNYFANFDEVTAAYSQNRLEIHSSIWVRCPPDIELSMETVFLKKVKFNNNTNLFIYNNLQRKETHNGKVLVQYLRTTPGRIIFNEYFNNLLSKEL